MVFLIVDSGSTKTDWRLIEDKEIKSSFITIGFNPYYYSDTQLIKEIKEKVLPELNSDIENIFFYGAGVSTDNKKQVVFDILNKIFPNSTIEVEHDLDAAARSLFQKDAGIACILGTGCNSCVYDGTNITHNFASLGYFFADEGSGTHIGKLFIEDYLRDWLPNDIKSKLEKEREINSERVLDIIYNQENPNKFLASFSPFVSENISHPYLDELVKRSFHAFFKTYIINYPSYKTLPLKFMGSVALIYEQQLREVAKEFNLEIAGIVKSPIEGLIEYHAE